jgi:uncharacterized protein
VIYLDSHALVKLVLNEKETPALRSHIEGRSDEMVTSELAITEVVRVVRRSCYDAHRNLTVDEQPLRDRIEKAGNLLDGVDQIVVDTDTFLRAGLFADDPHLGSLDASHLVCALEIGTALTEFVTYDKRLAHAAAQLGMPVTQPS